MTSLIAASAVFLLIHFVVSGTRWRDALVARLGERPYLGAFSFVSLATLIWMGRAYARAPLIQLWGPLPGLRPLAYALILIAFLFIVIGLATVSPTRVGMEGQLKEGADAARGMGRITRHPFLWGVSLWAFVHLVVNGDLAGVILFGTLLLLGLGGGAMIDAKRERRFPDRWQKFAQATSNVPFAAIAAGRNQLQPALREIGVLRPLIAIAVYAIVFFFHGRLFGAPLS